MSAERSKDMTPVAETAGYNSELEKYADVEGFEELYNELAKGIRSIKQGKVYTLEEAWEIIDKI